MNGVQLGFIKVPTVEIDPALETIRIALSPQKTTPATDTFLDEVKTEARKEGAYFVANRMLAAWEAGFIDDTAKNAADIARMILTSTEFMANARKAILTAHSLMAFSKISLNSFAKEAASERALLSYVT
ncbi:phage protein [Escherichia coli]|uniref:Phage protein n=1 Tax=Escherichia coli TaxID=562 RepID=A0A2X1LCH1_ECOLX|nr:phage protein [Escherichia coli]